MAIPKCEIHKTVMKQTPFYEFDDEKYYCVNCFRLEQAKKLIDSQLLEQGFVAVSVEDLKFINLTYSNLRTKEECKKGEDILNKYLSEAK